MGLEQAVRTRYWPGGRLRARSFYKDGLKEGVAESWHFNGKMATRRKILQAAGSKPASEFVADFLGREFNTDAYIRSLQNEHMREIKPESDLQDL